VTARHLIAFGDLSFLNDIDPDDFIDARRERIFVLARENLDGVDDASATMRNPQRRIFAFLGLLGENRHEELFFWGRLGLAFRRDFSDEDIALFDFGARHDDAALIEEGFRFFADVRDIAGDFFGAKLGIPALEFVFFDVDRGEGIFFHHPLRHDDGVFVVVTVPGHIGDQDVLAERKLAIPHRGAIGNDLTGFDIIAHLDDRGLVDAGPLVRAVEFLEVIDPSLFAFLHGNAFGIG